MSSRERQVQLPLGEARSPGPVASPSAPSRQRERQAPRAARLELGRLLMTPGARDAIIEAGQTPFDYLMRHASGDWGELEPCDRQANRDAIRHGDRVLSAYETLLGARLYVITEWDRSATTLLLREEY